MLGRTGVFCCPRDRRLPTPWIPPLKPPAVRDTVSGMSTALEILIGAGGTVAALLAVLLPVIRAQGSNLRREITGQGANLRRELDTLRGDLRADVASLRADVGEVRRDLHALSDRVARIEGALTTGPWRPTNGSPAAAPQGGTPEATAE